MEKSELPLQIPKQLDRYTIEDRIGSGGMGQIFKAFDSKLKRSVAIKIISDRVKDADVKRTISERFLNEARVAASLSHPNLVQIYDFGETSDVTYLVMEFVQGETLEELLKRKNKLNLEELLKMAYEMAGGLAAAHRKGIVHRDIKPSNVMIEAATGVTKVLDFGIAKIMNEEEMKLTSTGMVLGSTHYLSPEHITGKDLDQRSDIFCLGTLLYEAATGQLPFRGQNANSILYKIMHFDPQPIDELEKDIHPSFASLVMKCLAKAQPDRFQVCEEIEKAVKDIEYEVVHERKPSTTGHRLRSSTLKSYYVRDSQVLSILANQNLVTTDAIQKLRGKPQVVDNLLRDELMSEDEVARIIADCLDCTWIPRGRLKALKISEQAFKSLPADLLAKYNILPFYKDEDKKIFSLVIDGCHDFQREIAIEELFSKYQLQFYIAGPTSLRRTLEGKLKGTSFSGTIKPDKSQLLIDLDLASNKDGTHKRILLVDEQTHHQEALIRLFKKADASMVVASDSSEALIKVKNDRFDYVWASRELIGDELEFEALLLRQNAACEIRYFDHLPKELFEESVTYRKFREFQNKLVTRFLQQTDESKRNQCLDLAHLGLRIAQSAQTNSRMVDEVYFAVLLWKMEKITGGKGKSIELFDGIYRLQQIVDSLNERYDGRGPLGLRGEQIPLGTRILQIFALMDTIHPNSSTGWTPAEYADLSSKINQFSGKVLDPAVGAHVLDAIKPVATTAKKTKVAIIDSDPAYAKQLAAQLKILSADAQIYADGITALAALKDSKPDLIVSEILVNKLDGFSVCARVRSDENTRRIPFLILSSSDAPEHSTKAIQLGADDYLSKNADSEFILAKIERLLKRS